MSAKLKQFQIPALCLALIAGVWMVFGQVAHHDFINVDDNFYVYQNPWVTNGLTGPGIGWAFTHAHAANWHPLTWMSHMLDCQLYGLRPGGHHVTSVILHAANAVLLFLLLRRMTRATWPAAFVAALFALHPLRAESVAWAAERKDVLSGLFFILTLWAYVRYAEKRSPSDKQKPNARSSGATLDYALVLFCFALGLMAKPMLVTVPFILLLLDYWPLRRFETSTLPKLVMEKIPLLALVAASCGLTLWAQGQFGAIKSAGELSLPLRWGNAAVSYVTYIIQLLSPQKLAAYYPHPADKLSFAPVLGSVLLLLLITVLVCWRGRRSAYLPMGWFWYLIMLVPVIGLVQVGAQAHADRYTYLPQIGLAIIIVWGLADVIRLWPRYEWILRAASLVFLVAMAFLASWQTSFWRNSETLWRRALECNPNSGWIEKSLADALTDEGKLDDALDHYKRGTLVSPTFAEIRLNYGNLLYRQSRLDEARQELQTAVELSPTLDDARISLGVILYLQGQVEPAIQQFQQVLARHPSNAAVHDNLGLVFENQGRLEEAAAQYQSAVTANPSFSNARRNLARVLLAQGKATEAISHYTMLLAANPNDAGLHSELADALARAGQFDQAIAELQRALALLGPESEATAQKLRQKISTYQSAPPATPPPRN